MNKKFRDAFTNTGTVHGGQHTHQHHAGGSTTTTSSEDGREVTKHTDPQKAFEAMVQAEKDRKRR
jgi:hypothetical protein